MIRIYNILFIYILILIINNVLCNNDIYTTVKSCINKQYLSKDKGKFHTFLYDIIKENSIDRYNISIIYL